EFYRAVVNAAGMNVHLRQLAGRNTHHIIEASFKAFARALGQAVSPSGRGGVPSTKGVL
ncbi:MAG: imidazoleglycerol-phosphate dehydratase, partial [Armatimonadetes bacterium]|nr:imidazoleglycerol-phosphate dehydratase [Armatimonadota bacterium]